MACKRRRFYDFAAFGIAGVALAAGARRRNAAMNHVILLGDSVFDNASCVGAKPDVIAHIRSHLPAGWKASLLADRSRCAAARCCCRNNPFACAAFLWIIAEPPTYFSHKA
jgi:hypothetical protein